METKRCARCGNVLPLSDFYKEGDAYCKECKKKINKEYNKKKSSMRQQGNPALKDFTPRELIDELRFRGYRGELIFEQKIKI